MANSLTRRRLLEWTSVVLAGWLVACDQGSRSADNRTKRSQTLDLSSPAFEPEAFIPVEFTCDGADHSPALSWSAPPEGTQSFTLILDDPDAPNGTFTHWVLYDLPPDSQSLPTAIPAQPFLTTGGVQGKNDFGQYGYRGPCLPRSSSLENTSEENQGNQANPTNSTHRYFFRLYALDTVLDLPPGVTSTEVRTALKDHILAEAELMGRYKRQS
ncbi:MAG: YbhB/YbcL family Raf kinase inhibitor-like protein [Elainella sp. C42_A2020_010]|nr:YbhB/YbcL family Raf kinase inhibitor-like protein [Elainella sp. C42_A2020_010]